MDVITTEEQAVLDNKFMEMVIDAGLSFRVVDNPAVQAFFQRLRIHEGVGMKGAT